MISKLIGNVLVVTGVGGMAVTAAAGGSSVAAAVSAATAISGAATTQADELFDRTKNHGVEVNAAERDRPQFGKVNSVSMNIQDVKPGDTISHGLTVNNAARTNQAERG